MRDALTMRKRLRAAGFTALVLVTGLSQFGCRQEVAPPEAPSAPAAVAARSQDTGPTLNSSPPELSESLPPKLSLAAESDDLRPKLHVLEIPGFNRDVWRNSMLRFGEQHWQEFQRTLSQLTARYPEGRGINLKAVAGTTSDPLYKPYNTLLGASYYDFGRVLANLYEESGNPLWKERSLQASRFYADFYVLPNDGGIPGYWLFTDGLTWNAVHNKSPVAAKAAKELARKAAFARQTVPTDIPESAVNSREIAYAIIAYLNAEKLGDGRNPLLLERVDQALGHVDQWTGTAPWIPYGDKKARYVPPFMTGLTSYALARFYEQYKDAKGDPALSRRVALVPVKLTALAEWLAQHAWIPALKEGPPLAVENSFVYTWSPHYDFSEGTPGWAAAADLNALAAVPLAFSYHVSGNEKHYEIAAKALAGSAKAYLQGAKQFNQVYWLGPQVLKWLEQQPTSL